MNASGHPATLRLARGDDAEAAELARVHVASWRTTYAGLVAQATLDALDVDAKAARRRAIFARRRGPEDGVTWLAHDHDGALVGFADVGPARDPDLPCSGELYAIYLLRSAQRRGIGARLLRAGVASLRDLGHTSLGVWVLDGNPARRFYEALGGRYVTTKTITIDGRDYQEHGLVWETLDGL